MFLRDGSESRWGHRSDRTTPGSDTHPPGGLRPASDATGTKLIVAVNTGDVWTSTNGGLTWTDETTGNQAAGGPWDAVASNGRESPGCHRTRRESGDSNQAA